MARYHTPGFLRERDHHLLQAFLEIAEAEGVSSEDAASLVNLLPSRIKNAPTFKDRLSGLWVYECGSPHDVKNQTVVGGSVNQRADFLFCGIKKLRDLLRPTELLEYLRRLGDPEKHQDFLAELDPIVRSLSVRHVTYEPSEFSPGNRKLDWSLTFTDETQCVLDVKNRVTGILELLQTEGNQPPVPEGVFQNVETKFLPATAERFQGVWIWSFALYDRTKLQRQFDSLDRSLVQFAVFSHADAEPYMLTARGEVKDWIGSHFYLGTEVRMR